MNQKTWYSCNFKNRFIKGLVTDGDLRRELKKSLIKKISMSL